jgi:hypothetical protein
VYIMNDMVELSGDSLRDDTPWFLLIPF